MVVSLSSIKCERGAQFRWEDIQGRAKNSMVFQNCGNKIEESGGDALYGGVDIDLLAL